MLKKGQAANTHRQIHTRSLEVKQDRLQKYAGAKMAEKRCLEANKNTNLVSSHLINSGKQITPQLPSTGNQKPVTWCEQAAIIAYAHSHPQQLLVPQTTQSRFPKNSYFVCKLWLMREITGRVQPPWIWVKASQMVASFGGGGLQGNVMFQPVLPGKRTTNILGD